MPQWKDILAPATQQAGKYMAARAGEFSTRMAAPVIVGWLAAAGAPTEVQATVGPWLDWLLVLAMGVIAGLPDKAFRR